jgi:hypothetical protein
VVVTYCADPVPAQPDPVSGLVFVPGPAINPSTISGTLRSVGGRPPGLGIPLRGTVTATAVDGTTYDAVAGADGKFSISVPEGVYAVTGTSPQYQSGRAVCGDARGTFLIRPDSETRGVIVGCSEQ